MRGTTTIKRAFRTSKAGAVSRGRRRRRGRDSRTLVVVLAGLVASEVLGLCANGLASGYFTLDQYVGVVSALVGPILLLQGDQRARCAVAGFLIVLAGYGAYHMTSTPHRISVHSVTLVTQSLIRLGTGVLLFTRVARRFVQDQNSRRHGRRP